MKKKKKKNKGAVKVSKIVKNDIKEYGEYVLEQRHIPDYRDGLKPVMRRILYAMYKAGYRWDVNKFRKCAKVVGDTLGSYHPHGDQACYGALVTMTGDPLSSLKKHKKTKNAKILFYGPNNPYPFIEGYGNFGSIDGDKPAGMRYPECKLSILSSLMFALPSCIEQVPNYDNTTTEPLFLPSTIPSLLLNGVTGIGVGVSTDFPPHNMKEVLKALQYMLKHKKVTVSKLMKFIKGPDFPYGGTLVSRKEVAQVYKTGQGVISWGLNTELSQKGRYFSVKVIGIPYRLNIKKLIEKFLKQPDVKSGHITELGSDEIEIEFMVKTEKMAEKIIMYKQSVKNDWNVTIRKSETEVEFKHVNLVSYLQMWLDYCIEVHKQFFRNEIERLSAEIRRNEIKVRIHRNSTKVVDFIKKEQHKALIKLLKIKEDELSIVTSMSIGALSKTNIKSIKDRIKAKKEERGINKKNLKDTKAYLLKYFKSIEKFSLPRRTEYA